MIFAKATRYTINPEKLKGFIDYLYIFTKKARMKEENLSFEYALEAPDKILVLERWSTKLDYTNFINEEEFTKEIKTIEKMSKTVQSLYEVELIR
ncbi:antibiotic biosynthesis monooxygenase [Mycoplasma sp. Pen4]|uniref:antibiotic biosynthesis monooxygenase n=1 Tax=Mycoplasma sp. Pen4 TaxID=640330 RepID=UPI00165409FD|nr:antibiotic biosynthesis monooxygenase [Mycoplasma sp. Pen4]QNM93582.1 antibiotic biosynthesis monooxygenase [Mycoplasma sp. Pen4]